MKWRLTGWILEPAVHQHAVAGGLASGDDPPLVHHHLPVQPPPAARAALHLTTVTPTQTDKSADRSICRRAGFWPIVPVTRVISEHPSVTLLVRMQSLNVEGQIFLI